MTKLLGISGALRAASTNTQLVHNAARIFNADSFVLADLNLPLYDGDLEAEGIPASVQTLSDQIKEADAVIISTPEYNKSISGVLKNALDWVSRTEGSPWADKPVAIMSSAAGRAGGERAQFALRLCMMPFGTRLLQGPEVLIGSNFQEFDEQGNLTGERYIAVLTTLMEKLRAEI
ncbi:MAG: NAD(P)H-dependent oxidoreductase [Yoonia sp.]|jgi:chromate reductase|nr:NAD(P)H-dependent oxidoreductase [Yoonia sp.]